MAKRCVCGVANASHDRKAKRNQLARPKPKAVNYRRWRKELDK